MLDERGVAFRYRDYKKEPLSPEEVREVLTKLGVGPREVLRSRDANKLGLDGTESDEALIALMSEHPGLLQRPIGIRGETAVVGRPVENLLALC